MGTPDFSVPTLSALVEAGHHIAAVYTQPPRPAGRRGLELVKSPVHQAAEASGIDVFTPISLKGAAEQDVFVRHKADVAVVVAYGLILPQAVLDAPKFGCFNGHASLLPRWRGAAPIQRAIMAGDSQTGVMVMKMEAGLDTGPVAMTVTVPITDDTTAGDLHDALSKAGATLMVQALELLESRLLELVPQSQQGVTYAAKIDKSETRIDWSQSAEFVKNHIMGLSPIPGAWCEMPFGGRLERVKILKVEMSGQPGPVGQIMDDRLTIACGSGALRLLQLQRAGSKAMQTEHFLRGNPVATGTVLN